MPEGAAHAPGRTLPERSTNSISDQGNERFNGRLLTHRKAEARIHVDGTGHARQTSKAGVFQVFPVKEVRPNELRIWKAQRRR